MDKSKIEMAAKEAAMKHCAHYDEEAIFVKGFTDGAQWRINSAWHEVSETPQPRREFVYQGVRRGSLAMYYGIYTVNGKDDWDFVREFVVIERWAYLEDLLPDEGKETRQ